MCGINVVGGGGRGLRPISFGNGVSFIPNPPSTHVHSKGRIKQFIFLEKKSRLTLLKSSFVSTADRRQTASGRRFSGSACEPVEYIASSVLPQRKKYVHAQTHKQTDRQTHEHSKILQSSGKKLKSRQ